MSKVHWLALSAIPGVGGATARRLLERFGSIEEAFEAPEAELAQFPRVGRLLASHLPALSQEAMEAELDALSEEGIQVLTWDDDAYPVNLRALPDAPPVLFMRGELRPEDEYAVAVVGTRQPSPDAADRARRLARELAERGLTVVSGMALGVDTAAHLGALDAPGGRTLAVLGSGVRNVTPQENMDLAEQIVERGALLSEVRPDVAPRGTTLMARDRIISGLSRAVIVVEAAEKSGSVDTGMHALRQGRLLLASPGSPGTQALLARGAEAVEPDADLDALVQRIRAFRVVEEKAQLGLFGG